MGHKKLAKRKAQRQRRRIAKQLKMGYCPMCHKILWLTREKADQRIEELKAKPGVRKPYLLNSYRCRERGDGYHIGHDFRLGLPISPCIEEMK